MQKKVAAPERNTSEVVAAIYSMVLRSESQRQADDGNCFWNYGLWDSRTTEPGQASEQLMEYLLAKLPPNPGRILDVAFGKGESTRRLCRSFGEQNVVGINVAGDQLDAAHKRGVRCEMHVMDAARMQFEPGSFDAILCIEAAFHFRTRADFLEQAHSILRPGGCLVMSDMLLRSGYGLSPEVFPLENQVQSLEEYRAVFTDAGFADGSVSIERMTGRQTVPYFANLARSLGMLPFAKTATAGMTLSPADVESLGFMLPRLLNVGDCVVVAARK